MTEPTTRSILFGLTLSAFALLAIPANAQPGALESAAVHAAPQYYLISLPEAPVADAAEAVLGEALGLPYRIDPQVASRISVEIDGRYAPKALAQTFGDMLWNHELALIERPNDGLWIIPRQDLAVAVSQGARVVSLAETGTAIAPVATARPEAPAHAETPRDAGWFPWLVGGWLGGVACALAGMGLLQHRRKKRTRTPPATPILSDQTEARPDLVIPVFPRKDAQQGQPNDPSARS